MHVAVRGIRLNVEATGAGPPLLLLHGFMGNAVTWSGTVEELSRSHRCLALELPGHGQSDSPPDWRRYALDECVADVIAVLDSLGIARATVIGYSMGGRVGLSLAITHPDRVTALVCESANPGLSSEPERGERLRDDERLSNMIEAEGMRAFVDYWEKLPIFRSQKRLPVAIRKEIRAGRLATSPRGAANSLRGLGQGHQSPLWNQLAGLNIPVLIVAGMEDAKYRDIALKMQAVIRDADVAVIPGSGHTVHHEQPTVFVAAVLSFLERGGRHSGDTSAG